MPPTARPDAPRNPPALLLMLLVLLGSVRLVFPGDTHFINDEPQLIARALEDNAAGRLTTHGLRGTRGMDYGPLPIWIYRGLLLLSHDLLTIVLLRTLLVTTLTATALVWLARTCPFLLPAAGALAFVSPYLWLYSRDLWDNSFNIPFVALAFAAYVAFCREHRTANLVVAAFGCVAAFLTHLMSLPLCAAIGLHFVLFEREWIRRHVRQAVVLGAACAGVAAPYLAHLASGSGGNALLSSGKWRSFFFAIAGGRFFTATGLDYFLGEARLFGEGTLLHAAELMLISLTCLAFPLIAWGAWRSFRVVTSRDTTRASREAFAPAFVALTTLVLHVALAWSHRLTEHPHYYNACWIAFLFCLWWGVSECSRRGWGRILCGTYAVALTVMLVAVPLHLHRTQGNRELHYGPTLANQLEIARQLNALSATLSSDVPLTPIARHPGEFPHALAVLRRLEATRQPTPRSLPDTLFVDVDAAETGTLEIGYAAPNAKHDGRVSLSRGRMQTAAN